MFKILVTGADGFIGKNFINFLKKKKISFFELGKKNGDLCQSKTWSNIPKVNVIVHLACKVMVPKNNIEQYVNDNLKITLNMLDYAQKNKSNVVFVSTYMYGKVKKFPTDENSEVVINNEYTLWKKLSEELCSFYSKKYKIKINILRTFNIYGNFQKSFFLIPSLVNQSNNKKIIVNDDKPKRDLLFISDYLELLLLSCKKFNKLNIFNVGFGKSFSIKKIVKLMGEINKKKYLIEVKNIKRPNEIPKTIANIKKTSQFFNWKPKVTVKDGLKIIMNKI